MMTPTTKITARQLADVRHGYLYATGDLVLIHEMHTPKLGRQEYVTRHRYAGQCHFKGRVVLHGRGEVRLALASARVAAEMPALSHGSDNTKAKGQPVGYVGFDMGKGGTYRDTVTIYELPGMLSGGVTVQDDDTWVEPENPWRWGDLHVAQ